MLLHPEVQKKAQEQIDQVVGPDRLPDFSDRESLPYIDCIVQETLRCVQLALANSMLTEGRADVIRLLHWVSLPSGTC